MWGVWITLDWDYPNDWRMSFEKVWRSQHTSGIVCAGIMWGVVLYVGQLVNGGGIYVCLEWYTPI